MRIILTEKGKQIFKGGNIEVMKPNLKEIKDKKEFEEMLLRIGTGQREYYTIEE